MAIKLFGFTFGKDEEEISNKVIPENLDGSVEISGITGYASGGAFGTYVDLEGTVGSESDLIKKYREMIINPECDSAVADIINEAIVSGRNTRSITLNLDNLNVDDEIKKVILKEFDNILLLLDFENEGYDIFKRWYVDGRLYYQIVVDEKNPKKGFNQLKYIDALKIKKIREIKSDKNNVNAPKKIIEYYIYQEKGLKNGTTTTEKSIKITVDSIAYCHSGIHDSERKQVLSHLHKAIKPLNQLRMAEDAVVIYRIARSPERRIFYVDTGNLPKIKAEQYVRELMNKYKNRLVYDSNTGELRDDRKHMTMLEDYWMPRREGGRGTEVNTLPGGQNLGEIEDILYFQRNLYKALNVPISRLESGTGFTLGRATEISRDELKFTRFVERLRARFCLLFDDLLSKQLRLKQVLNEQDWNNIKNDIHYNFESDSHFAELKNLEIVQNRLGALRDIEPYIGKYYSNEWVRKNMLFQTEREISEQDEQIVEEQNILKAQAQEQEQNEMMQNGGAGEEQPQQPDNQGMQ